MVDDVVFTGGMDFGYKEPFAFIFSFVGSDGIIYVTDEWERSQLLLAVHSHAVKTIVNGRSCTIYADHDAQDAAEMRKLGVYSTPAYKEDKMANIQLAYRLIKHGKIKIHRKCERLIKELSSYIWSPTKDWPVEVNDHCVDAFLYMVAGIARNAKAMSYINGDYYGTEKERSLARSKAGPYVAFPEKFKTDRSRKWWEA